MKQKIWVGELTVWSVSFTTTSLNTAMVESVYLHTGYLWCSREEIGDILPMECIPWSIFPYHPQYHFVPYL